MTRFTNTAKLAAVAATVATVMLAYSAMFAPASAQPATSTSTSTSSSNPATPATSNAPAGMGAPFHGKASMRGDGPGGTFQSQASLTVGQTITVTSTQGEYFLATDHTKNGTASGTLTFTVTGKLASGYTLSITSGSLVANGTTYTVASGSAQMGRGAAHLVGQGATSSFGQFLLRADARGSFAGTTASVSIDLSAGTTEYLVFLAGGITG